MYNFRIENNSGNYFLKIQSIRGVGLSELAKALGISIVDDDVQAGDPGSSLATI